MILHYTDVRRSAAGEMEPAIFCGGRWPKTDNSDKWIIVSIFVQPANLKTNLIFGAAWGEAENQDKVDKWINARDLMLPGRGKRFIRIIHVLSPLSTLYPDYP